MEWAPRSSHLRKTAEDDGVAAGGLDLQHHLRGEKDAGVASHQASQNDPGDPHAWRANCQICTLASPPGVSSGSRFEVREITEP
jgi:hypothetical protein